jgi:hypothetical protein
MSDVVLSTKGAKLMRVCEAERLRDHRRSVRSAGGRQLVPGHLHDRRMRSHRADGVLPRGRLLRKVRRQEEHCD